MKRVFFIVSLISIMASFVACQDNSIDDQGERIAADTNKQCPQIVEPGQQIDSMSYDRKTHTFTYYYSLSGECDNDMFIQFNKKDFHKNIESAIVNDPASDPFIKAGVSFHYIYRSSKNPSLVRYDDTFRFNVK